MPTLKDITCTLELPTIPPTPLQETHTTYHDALVETTLVLPQTPNQQPFTIHLTSHAFIAHGIAMFVFIDGVYQCNRNRQNLRARQPPDRRSVVDFRVRQGEEKSLDGSMVARGWKFAGSGDGGRKEVGCVEVVVLRCVGERSGQVQGMNLDGAADYVEQVSRGGRSRGTAFDDRELFGGAGRGGHGVSTERGYRSPYAETVRSREGTVPRRQAASRSRYSEPLSPLTPRRDIPAPAFQYGSGPLPPRSRMQRDEAVSDRASKSIPAVDPALLERIVADAVKRGVQASRNPESRNGVESRWGDDGETASQVPGAWPASPTHPGHDRPQSYHSREDLKGRGSTRSRAETHVAWDDEPGWDKQSLASEWGSAEGKDDGWDTERWKQPTDWEEVNSKLQSRDRSPSPSHASIRIFRRSLSRRSRSKNRSHARASHWRDDAATSSEDNDGWTHVRAPSRSSASTPSQSDSTLQPSHSRSQIRACRRTSRPPSRSGVSHSRRPVQHYPIAPSSVLITAPTLLTNAPVPYAPTTYSQSVRPQVPHEDVAPPPTWGCARPETVRSGGWTYVPPAPFSTIEAGGFESSGDSWGGTVKKKKKKKKKKTEKKNENSRGRSRDKSKKAWSTNTPAWHEEKPSSAWDDVDAKPHSWGEDSAFAPPSDATWSSEREKKAHHKTRDAKSTAKTEKKTKKPQNQAETTKKHNHNPPPSKPERKVFDADDMWTGLAAWKPATASPPPANQASKSVKHHTTSSAPRTKPERPAENETKSAILTDPPTAYGHLVSRPEYVDGLEKPYAVFRFHVRSSAVGEKGASAAAATGAGISGEMERVSAWVAQCSI